MIKFITKPDKRGKCMLGFGLSNGNLDQLKVDRPIIVKAVQLGLADLTGVDRVAILYGETEAAIAEKLGAVTDMIDASVNVETEPDHLNEQKARKSWYRDLEILTSKFIRFDHLSRMYKPTGLQAFSEVELAYAVIPERKDKP